MSIYVEVGTMAGDDIQNTLKECIELSKHLQIDVRTKFNGVTCLIWPSTDICKILESFRKEIRSEHPFPIATG